jgi:hypothetical protein
MTIQQYIKLNYPTYNPTVYVTDKDVYKKWQHENYWYIQIKLGKDIYTYVKKPGNGWLYIQDVAGQPRMRSCFLWRGTKLPEKQFKLILWNTYLGEETTSIVMEGNEPEGFIKDIFTGTIDECRKHKRENFKPEKI